MMRFALPFSIVLGLSAAAFAADPPSVASRPAPAAPTAIAFEKAVADGNRFEIESSKLALSRSKSGTMQSFAKRLIEDHTTAAAKFERAVAEAKLSPPPKKLDAKHQAILDGLQGKEGTSFDKAYIDAQYDAHVETVALFKAYAARGDNATLQMFAQDVLPTLQTHLDVVDKLR